MPLKLRDLFNDDLDTVFSYRTSRFVIIKDPILGCTHKLIQIAIMLYVVVYVLILDKGYIKKEYTSGTTVMIKTGGELVMGSKGKGKISAYLYTLELYIDGGLGMYPKEDPNGFFFSTKYTIIT